MWDKGFQAAQNERTIRVKTHHLLLTAFFGLCKETDQ